MAETSFPGGATPGETGSFLSDPGAVWSTGLMIPTDRRVANNGDRPVLVTRIRAYVSGRGATRSCRLGIDRSGETRVWSGYFNAAAAGSAQDAGWKTVNRLAPNGGEHRVFIESDGSFYFGRAVSGGATNILGGASNVWAGSLSGEAEWFEVPSAPQSLTAVDSGSGSVALDWTAPAATGGTAITGYRILYDSNASFTSPAVIDVGTATARTVSGLTVGTTYYFRVYAKNAVTEAAGTYSVASNTATASTGTVPDAPTIRTGVADLGFYQTLWGAPASSGGVAITKYEVQYATNDAFTGAVTVDRPSDARIYTLTDPTPSTTYYSRVRAVNAVGAGAWSATASATTPARHELDMVWGASISLPNGGGTAALRSNGGNPATVDLVHVPFNSTTPAVVGTMTGFFTPGGLLNLDLVADPSGNLYVIGSDSTAFSTLRVAYYMKTGASTWAYQHALTGALPATDDAIQSVAAAFVPGTGSSPISTIVVLARRFGTRRAGAVSFGVVSVAAAQAGSGTLLLSSGSNPSWLSTPPTTATPNTGTIDVTPLTAGSTRLAVYADTPAAIDVVNGTITSLSKGDAGAFDDRSGVRILGIDSTRYAVLIGDGAAGSIAWSIMSTTGAVLASGTESTFDTPGSFFPGRWDAYYNAVSQTIKVYFVGSSSVLTWGREDFNVNSYTWSGSGSGSGGLELATIGALRVPDGVVDERAVLLERAHVDASNAKLTTRTSDTSSNVAPSAPSTSDLEGYDATVDRSVSWVFGDANPADVQTAYQVDVATLAGAVVHTSGKVAGAASTYTIPAGALTNGTSYQWRVRTYDVLDAAGTWSAYDQFTVSATGTLTITDPAADNPAGLELATLPLTWTFVQASGYTQTQRRIRVVRVTDGVVLSDTGMLASTSNSATVALPSEETVRIELSIVSNAPGTPTIGPVSRTVTSIYGRPMTPVATISEIGEAYVAVAVSNPAPTGDRPEVARNIVERRRSGVGVDYEIIGSTTRNGIFFDYSVAAGVAYDYRVRGVTE